MNVETALLDSLKVFVGILISSASTASASDNRICHGSWTYSNLGNGWGCVRPLTSKFSDRMCLTRGYHIALKSDKDGGKKQKLICVKDQSDRDCRVDKYVTPRPMTSSEPPSYPHIDAEDTKAVIDEQPDTKDIVDERDDKDDDKTDLARPMGCCMPGLEGR